MEKLGFVSMKKLGDAVSSFISNHIELWDHLKLLKEIVSEAYEAYLN